MKTCNKCKEVKPDSSDFFYKDKKGKGGLAQTCKACTRERSKKWIKENKERKKAYDTSYAKKNAANIKEYQKEYREKNKESISEYNLRYRRLNSDSLKEKAKKYNSNPLIKARRNSLNLNRKKHDAKYRLTSNVRSMISSALRGKNGALRHVSWSIDDLKTHLEKQFTQGMSWDNYGEWHVDHILPICSFKYESQHDAEFKHCWSLSNLMPLWAKDNCSKQSKITHLI